MLGLSISEILFLAVLALIVIGPKQLPEVARTIGRLLNELRRSTSVFTEELKSQVRIDTEDLNPLKAPAPKPVKKPTPPVEEGPVQQELTVQNPEVEAVIPANSAGGAKPEGDGHS